MAYIQKAMTKCSPTNPLHVPIDKVLTDDDMKQVFNTWQNNHEDWMDEATLRMLPDLTPKKRQAKIHQAFSAMQFQLLGNKHLIHYLIKYPLRSAEQPAGQGSAERPAGTDAAQPDFSQRAAAAQAAAQEECYRAVVDLKEAARKLDKHQFEQKALLLENVDNKAMFVTTSGAQM